MKTDEKNQENGNSDTTRSNNIQSELSDAVYHRDWDRVLAAVGRGADPQDSRPAGRGYSAVHEVIGRGKSDVLHSLLRLGADPNYVEKHWNRRPLDVAAQCLDAEAIDVLVKAGANVNARRESGCTPLAIVCSLPPGALYPDSSRRCSALPAALETMQRLLVHGADPNLPDDNGNTALHHAVEMRYLETVRLLLEHGADASLRNRHEMSPMDVARRNRDVEISRMLDESVGRAAIPR